MERRITGLVFSLSFFVIGCGSSQLSSLDGDDGDPNSTIQNQSASTLSGSITPSGASKRFPNAKTDQEGYMVVAQSKETGQLYRCVTDAEGKFECDLPDNETGSTMMVTIVSPEGKPIGPVIFDNSSDQGTTGLKLEDNVSLGSIELPSNPTASPIQPGADSDNLTLDETQTARLNDGGAPIGLETYGKGTAAKIEQVDETSPLDKDKDGLIDVLDADDNGNGKVDDFEGDGSADGGQGQNADYRVNFFMNLKIQAESAQTYYSGTEEQRNAALANDTVITLEVVPEPTATRQITAVSALETPGPSYMPIAEIATSNPRVKWSANNFEFTQGGDGRFEVFVVPTAVMNSGDTFTVNISMDDNTTEQYTRMINYVFKNIPKLVKYGVSGSLTDFSINDQNINGSPSKPIPFDGNQDLTMVFNPPSDETGQYLEGLDYDFQFFFYDGNGQIYDIDIDKTWPVKPTGMDSNGSRLLIPKDQLTLSAENTYTFTIPKEFFPHTVITTTGQTKNVSSYKVDITAECSSGNCAIMVILQKNP
jgi:hypothetical protein